MTTAMLSASRGAMFIARYAICWFISHSVLLLTASPRPSAATASGSYDPESVYPQVAAGAAIRSRALLLEETSRVLLQDDNPDSGGDRLERGNESGAPLSRNVGTNISRSSVNRIRERRPSHSTLYKVRALSTRQNFTEQKSENLNSLLSKYNLQPYASIVKSTIGNTSLAHNVTRVRVDTDSSAFTILPDEEAYINLKQEIEGSQIPTSTASKYKSGERLPTPSSESSNSGKSFTDLATDVEDSLDSPLETISEELSQEIMETSGTEHHSRSNRRRKVGRLSSLDPERRKAILAKRNKIKERRKLLLRGQSVPASAADVTPAPAVTTKASPVTTTHSSRQRAENTLLGSGGGGRRRLRTSYKSVRQRARGRATKAPTTDAPLAATTPSVGVSAVRVETLQSLQGIDKPEHKAELKTKNLSAMYVREDTEEKQTFRNNNLKGKTMYSGEKWGLKNPQHPVFKRIKLPVDINAHKKKVKSKPYKSSEDIRNPPDVDYPSYDELYDPAPPGPRYTTKPSTVLGKKSSTSNHDQQSSGHKTITRSHTVSSSSTSSLANQLPKASHTEDHNFGTDRKQNPDPLVQVSNAVSSGKTFGGVIPYFPHPRHQPRGISQVPHPQLVSPSRASLLPHLPPVPLVSGLVGHVRGLPPHSVRSPLVPRPVSIVSSPPVYYPESSRSPFVDSGSSLPHHIELEDYETDDGDYVQDSFEHDRDSIENNQNSFRLDHNSFEQDLKFFHDDRDTSSPRGLLNVSPVPIPLDHDVPPDPLYDAMFHYEHDQERLNVQDQFDESRDFRHGHNKHEHDDYDDYDITPEQPAGTREPVQYGYRVASADTGNFQQRNEQREGKKVKGSYQVALPDGRIQTVNYIADDDGFRAEVTYENIDAVESSTPYPPSVTTAWPANSPSLQPSHPSLSNSLLPDIRQSSRRNQNPRPVSNRPPILPPQRVPLKHDRRRPVSVEVTTPSVPLLQRQASAVTERPHFLFNPVTRGQTIRPPTQLPSRNRAPPVHLPSPVHDGRHVSQEAGRGQGGRHVSNEVGRGQNFPGSFEESPRPFPIHQSFPQQSPPLPDFANDWLGDFNAAHNNQQHRPVKPAPVKISLNNPSGIPFYPGINLPQGLQHEQLSARPVRPAPPSINLPPVSTTHSNQPHRTQNRSQNRRPHARKTPARSKPTDIKKGQIDFQQHIHVTTPSPNPFRVTLSGNKDKVRPRTTSRGRVMSVAANSPSIREHESMNRPIESRSVESSKSFQSLEVEQPRERHHDQLDHRLDDVIEFYLQSSSTTTPRTVYDPSVSSVSPSPLQLSIPSPRRVTKQSNPPFHNTPVYIPETSPSPSPQSSTESPAPTSLTPSSMPLHQRISARTRIPPVFPPPLPGQTPESRSPQLFHYESEVESSRESRERATLYNHNSPIFLQALGKSRSVPLLLPYPLEDDSSLLSDENARSPRFIPYELSRNISQQASPILSPVPVFSLLDR